jgi:hypothetical protein
LLSICAIAIAIAVPIAIPYHNHPFHSSALLHSTSTFHVTPAVELSRFLLLLARALATFLYWASQFLFATLAKLGTPV